MEFSQISFSLAQHYLRYHYLILIFFFLLGIAFSAGIIKYGSIETEDGKIVPDKRLQAFARLIHYQKWLQ